jgi:hypothetical protein
MDRVRTNSWVVDVYQSVAERTATRSVSAQFRSDEMLKNERASHPTNRAAKCQHENDSRQQLSSRLLVRGFTDFGIQKRGRALKRSKRPCCFCKHATLTEFPNELQMLSRKLVRIEPCEQTLLWESAETGVRNYRRASH